MKIHSHTKKQLISLGVMALIFVITVIYSIGYFDFTFIDRPTDTDRAPSTQRQEYTSSPEETAYDDTYNNKSPKNLVAILVEEQLQLTLSLNHNIGLRVLNFVCHNKLSI